MKTFLIPVFLIILAYTQTFEIKRLHPIGSRSDDASSLKENFILDKGINPAKPRIAGGVPASLGEIPFQVSIDVDNHYFTGGAIIHPWYILTAAIYVHGGKNFNIYAGVVKLRGDESSRQVMVATEKYVHEKYNRTHLQANIALLKLPQELHFNKYVSAAYLPSNDYAFANDIAWMSGWGTSYPHGEFAPILQVTSAKILSNEECLDIWGDWVSNSTICTRTAKGVGECDGDRGGPLFTNTTSGSRSLLVGILSFHASKGCGVLPDVFTRISSYTQWISDHIE